jgi:hypothetical protein
MPASVAAAIDKAGMGVPVPTTDRPGVPRRGGAGGTLELLRSGEGVRRTAFFRVRREPRAKEATPTRRLGETMRRTRLALDDPFGRVIVDDSTIALPHTPHSTWGRVGSRGPILSKVNTPLRIVPPWGVSCNASRARTGARVA